MNEKELLEYALNEIDKNFERDLQSLINRYSKENDSNTPDFILAQYMHNCLLAFNLAVKQREAWYGMG